ncbi:hypothetical protein F8M41_021018 [Gigaspora margarita]|uniref:Uncharacterized protein n=1 Tax=Gigaspora margarita TaxID=4874 RepID=A0A8H4B1N9_GIGMA|nr:hypothetical protein F8M41_021018 [Gigaspora margarita]
MPCYADTIVKVKIVYQTVKEEDNLMVVWTIGMYPVKCEDNNMEMVLFVPIDSSERDYETQAIFEKNSFFSVGRKIIPGYYKGNKRIKKKMFDNTSKISLEAVNMTRVESCDESEDKFDHTDLNSVKFGKFTELNEDVYENVSDNLSKKENSQKKKKEKESVGGSLCSALRSYKSSVSSIDNE